MADRAGSSARGGGLRLFGVGHAVAIEPQGKRVSVLSDNPAYPSWRGLEKRTINIVGRVLWFGRALR